MTDEQEQEPQDSPQDSPLTWTNNEHLFLRGTNTGEPQRLYNQVKRVRDDQVVNQDLRDALQHLEVGLEGLLRVQKLWRRY